MEIDGIFFCILLLEANVCSELIPIEYCQRLEGNNPCFDRANCSYLNLWKKLTKLKDAILLVTVS